MSGIQLACIATAFLVLSIAFGSTAWAAQPPHVEGALETEEAVRIAGAVQVRESTEGAVHYHDSAQNLHQLTITGDVEVTSDWQKGHEARVLGTPQRVLEPGDGSGRVHRYFPAARINITPLQPVPEFLGILPRHEGTIILEGTGTDARTVVNKAVTQVEFSKDSKQSPPSQIARPGFHYIVPGPWTETCGLERATIRGNFTLFANNVTVHVEESDEGQWEYETGYLSRSTTGPVVSFETRVTVINVTNGVLQASTRNGLCLYGAGPRSDVDGIVQAASVTGELVEGVNRLRRYEFKPAPLDLRGVGSLELRPLPSGGQADGLFAYAGHPRLSVLPSGNFEIRSTLGLHVASVPAASTDAAPAWAWWLAAVVIGVLLVAIATNRHARAEIEAWYAKRVRERREVSAQHELQAGRMLLQEGKAAAAYARLRGALALAPDDLELWYWTAVAAHYSGHAVAALDALQAAHGLSSSVEPSVLEGVVVAASSLARWDVAVDAALRLAPVDPERARRLVRRYSALRTDPRTGHLAFEPDERWFRA